MAFDPPLVCITGASSGIGEATAVAYARRGFSLALGARRTDRLEQLASRLTAAGSPRVWCHNLDVRVESSLQAFVEAFQKAFEGRRCHTLVNNAGLALKRDAVATGQFADWRQMMDTNCFGAFAMTQLMLPLMKQPGGSVLFIGSIAGREPYEGGALYCASKAALRIGVDALRLELNGTGLRVGIIEPGMAETEFSLVRFMGDRKSADAVYQGMTPLTAGDIADSIVWMSEQPAHVCISQLVLLPTDQASATKVFRRS